MALIMYLNRVPRCKKNITVEDIKLMDSYFSWQYHCEIGSRYGCNTFEKWCGHSESELPSKDTIDFYRQFWTKRNVYVEGIGEGKRYSIFEQLARIPKANQLFNWFIKNVMHNTVNRDYYEVTKEQLESLLQACIKVKDSCTFLNKNENIYEDECVINEVIAKETLPIMTERGYFFGPDTYSTMYVIQIIEAIDIVKNILKTTDFKNQVIYFNAIW